MPLPSVSGATLRGTTYHYNLPIPASVQARFQNRAVFRGTMRTSDPKEAERQIRAQRSEFDRLVKGQRDAAERGRLKSLLDPAEVEFLNEVGGISGLIRELAVIRTAAAFKIAGENAEFPASHDVDGNIHETGLTEDGDLWRRRIPPVVVSGESDEVPPHVRSRVKRENRAELEASLQVLSAEARRIKSSLTALGEDLPMAVDYLDESATGITELASLFVSAKNWTSQNRQALKYTVKRWIELHGDLPLEKLRREHLNKFDSALKGMPITREKRIASLRIKEAIEAARKEGLDTMSDKIRGTRIDHMKALSAFAMDRLGVITKDPFFGYKIDKAKIRHSVRRIEKTAPFQPAQVREILRHCASTFHQDTLDRWAPILSAYTAARREEIGQLTVADVIDWEGGISLRITDEDDLQKVKNRHSFRTIPVPPVLIDAGFDDFVARRRQEKGRMLFMVERKGELNEIAPTGRGRFTETYGEYFTRHVRKPLKLESAGLTFHSLRHSWTDAARRSGIESEIRRLIAGRLDGEDSTEASYGGADLLPEKLAAMIRVTPFVTKD